MAALQYLVYGERDGTLVHISDVPSGRACDCRCPACHEELIARKGKVMTWHFAHVSGSECATAGETALHKMAKAYLLQKRELCLPPVTVSGSYPYRRYDEKEDDDYYESNYGQELELLPGMAAKASDMGAELAFGDVTPDVWMRDMHGNGWFMEILVTHAVDHDKIKKLRRLGVPTLEADFSDFPRDLDPDEFAAAAPEAFQDAKWLYHPVIDAFWKLDATERYVRFHRIRERGILIPRDINCPECGHELDVFWSDHYDAWLGDCPLCGRAHVALKHRPVFRHTRPDLRVCPECGHWMTLKSGKYGNFWGCENWPMCTKTLGDHL